MCWCQQCQCSTKNMLNRVFCCPICNKVLEEKNGSLQCENGHCYDISKKGYVNLLPPSKSKQHGDNKEMMQARQLIMSGGYYDELANVVINELANYQPQKVLDVGSGEGYFARKIKAKYPNAQVVGVDISKPAIELAAKTSKDISYAVASSKHLPIENNSVDCIICAFAPFFADEFLRVIKKDGVVCRILPNENHMYKLKAELYDNVQLNIVDPPEIEGLELQKEQTVDCLDYCAKNENIEALIKMTPYYYRTSMEKIKKVSELNSLNVDLHFLVRMYKKTF